MSKDSSSTRFVDQNNSNVKEFDYVSSSIHFPPPRTPLNSITDPFQYQTEMQDADFDPKDKSDAIIRAGRSSEKKSEVLEYQLKGFGNVGLNHGTPRVFAKGKVNSEPNSAHSTPARVVSRTSNVGASGACTGPRLPQYTGGKGGSFSRALKGISDVNSEVSVEVPHFELMEDPFFWKDHNVQVFIRIRPLSSTEKVSQGYGRCLRQDSAQTVTWLGHPETRFTFDHIACETISQEKLFRVAGLPMVENCMSGYNSCMFAYGQTGSGKTYTMMGEIGQTEGMLKEDCGITPRIFEYLFTRIREEEESRRNERLKYSCKCSFLEIYNEQITDLLEPSSINLQLREDLKNGVYVENLTEYNVRTVNDVLKLLLQGAANRKMAATHMNSESSRSHSVFTCIIESHWEKDSMTHIRFGRLNLVDLAGSERQKSSGADGERLKEAANINKSLSTLGLVIMSLVDLAHGKQRHVPYRDSRLTFLLQDSLGGNSKTTVIANVSPSTCSASETLSTLKFAQRAKLIQNNAKVNEDASGDVTALQRQIQQLKGQLYFLTKDNKISRSLSDCLQCPQHAGLDESGESYEEKKTYNDPDVGRTKVEHLEATLAGALRREKSAEAEVSRLKVEVEQMNHLAHQWEEDALCSKMIIRLRDEKIKRLELLADGLITADKCLMDENTALRAEIQLLQAMIDKNTELTRVASDNTSLLEQLRLFQYFYEEGEREKVLAKISKLRNQENWPKCSSKQDREDNEAPKELREMRIMNSELIRKVNELQMQVETKSLSIDSGDEIATIEQPVNGVTHVEEDQRMENAPVLHSNDTLNEYIKVRSWMEAMELEQARLIEELHVTREENDRLMMIINNEGKVDMQTEVGVNISSERLDLENQTSIALQTRLDWMTTELEEVWLLNGQHMKDHLAQSSSNSQIKTVCEEVDMETTKAILHLQEEVAGLQSELHKMHCSMTEENLRLADTVSAKEREIRILCEEWKKAVLDLTGFLIDGSKSLRDASGQIESITGSFSHVNVGIGEHIEKAAKIFVEREETILLLKKSLEDAQGTILLMEEKLNSLRGATVVLAEVQQLENDSSTQDALQLTTLLDDKTKLIDLLEDKHWCKESQTAEAEKHANDAFLAVKRLSDYSVVHRDNAESDMLISEVDFSSSIGTCIIPQKNSHCKNLILEDYEMQIELAKLGLLETDNAIQSSCIDAQIYLLALQTDIQKSVSLYKELISGFMKDIREMRRNFTVLKHNLENFQTRADGIPPFKTRKFPKHENHQQMHHTIRDELEGINSRFCSIKTCINTEPDKFGGSVIDGNLREDVQWNADSATSCSSHSAESVAPDSILDATSSSCNDRFCENMREQTMDKKYRKESTVNSDDEESDLLERLGQNSSHNIKVLICLKEEFDTLFDAFNRMNVQFAALVNEYSIRGYFDKGVRFHGSLPSLNNNEQIRPEMSQGGIQTIELTKPSAEASYRDLKQNLQFAAGVKSIPGNFLFSKFQEVQATMKEADFMLNALLKANENAGQLSTRWKQTSENLPLEKLSLVEEIRQLKASVPLGDGGNEIWQDRMHCSLIEVKGSMSLLEQSFLSIQTDIEQMCNDIFSDALTVLKDMLNRICILRSILEDICSFLMENGLFSFVLRQWYNEKFTLKFKGVIEDPSYHLRRFPRDYLSCLSDTILNVAHDKEVEDLSQVAMGLEGGDLGQVLNNLVNKNLKLKKELIRKEVILKGVLFDFSLLQESACRNMDIKDESKRLLAALSQVRQELHTKTSQLNDLLDQYKKLQIHLAEVENDLFMSNSDLEQAKGAVDVLSDQNAELRVLLKDLKLKKSEIEEHLEEQREVVKSLEKEIILMSSSEEKQMAFSMKEIEDDLLRTTSERDQLLEQVSSLQLNLDMVYALADENEAIANEARQNSEASKLYAEQKEEEVKILEHSVEELECTINVLEKKVYEMEEELERHQLIRDTSELEIQSLRQRLLVVENMTENMDSDCSNSERLVEDHLSRELLRRSLELHEAHNRIKVLEEGKAEVDKEIERCKDYTTEIVLHAEAQASQYQQKYKTLEAMVHEVKMEPSNFTSAPATVDKAEKMRTRGSSSPFKCISNLVQQIDSEKDQELSMAKLRIKELEELVASRQREVCTLNARLAAAESMTHDVIRDLLGVKLDITNYANLIDQSEVQKLVEGAQQQTREFITMEQEILKMKRQIDDLIEERNRREADTLAAQMTLEQLQQRDQLLTAQNEMLKVDKTNLLRRVAELDDMLKKLHGKENIRPRVRPTESNLSKGLPHSEKLLTRVNSELAYFNKRSDSHSLDELDGRRNGTKKKDGRRDMNKCG